MEPLPAIVLAAGSSSRLGRPKQLEVVGGERLLERAVRLAREAGCAPVVVLGCHAERIASECRLQEAQVVLNQAWATGMASSLRAGLTALAADAQGALVMTSDQPAVTAVHLRELAQVGVLSGCATGSSYAGRRGVPAFFPASSFAELMSLEGDTGARNVLREAKSIPLEGGELDVDTEESLAEARRWIDRASR